MPLYTADALILRTYRLGDADRIVVFLTCDRGKKRGVARGARSVRSRFVGALEPLTHVSVGYYERENRDLVRLRQIETVRSPLVARAGDALTYVGYFAELMDEWAPEADPNERLYRLGASVVEALAGGAPVARLARYFEYWLLRLQGVYPSLTRCANCGGGIGDAGAWVSSRDGTFVCGECRPTTGAGLSLEALTFLRAASRVPPGQLVGIALSSLADRQLEGVHQDLISAHLEREPRSLRVLRSIARTTLG